MRKMQDGVGWAGSGAGLDAGARMATAHEGLFDVFEPEYYGRNQTGGVRASGGGQKVTGEGVGCGDGSASPGREEDELLPVESSADAGGDEQGGAVALPVHREVVAKGKLVGDVRWGAGQCRPGVGPVERLVELWEESTGYEGYYWRLRSELEKWGEEVGLSVRMMAEAFAALSPNNSEKMTFQALAGCIREWQWVVSGSGSDNAYPCPWARVPGYGLNRKKAIRILRGEKGVLKGLKVTAFYHNITQPWSWERVTVDGHIGSAMVGKRLSMKEAAVLGLHKPTIYHAAEEMVRTAARRVGEAEVSEFQAAAWLAWRRRHGVEVGRGMATLGFLFGERIG